MDGSPVRARSSCTNPRSVGERASVAHLTALARTIALRGADAVRVVAAHGAAATQRECDAFARLLDDAFRGAGLTVTAMLVTNDIVPLLVRKGLGGCVLAVVAGTGTGFAARRGSRSWARTSGLEYLLSDEGGGFDLGLRGLRAAVKALDGRGPRTGLLTAVQDWAGAGKDELRPVLFGKVYGEAAKLQVAGFAERVMSAASAGDEVATQLVNDAQQELVVGAVAAARQAGIGEEECDVVLSGSLLAQWPWFGEAVLGGIRAEVRVADATVAPTGDPLPGMIRLSRLWDEGFLRGTSLGPIPCSQTGVTP
jgi:N-acetylglucosamine kinase-like BadF-type ATPase